MEGVTIDSGTVGVGQRWSIGGWVEGSHLISDWLVWMGKVMLTPPLDVLRECMHPDWDGEGAKPIDLQCVRIAEAFLQNIPDARPPSPSALPDGSVVLYWKNRKSPTRCTLYLEIQPTEHGPEVLCYYRVASGKQQTRISDNPLIPNMLSFAEPALSCLRQTSSREKPRGWPEYTLIAGGTRQFVRTTMA